MVVGSEIVVNRMMSHFNILCVMDFMLRFTTFDELTTTHRNEALTVFHSNWPSTEGSITQRIVKHDSGCRAVKSFA